MSDHDPAPEPQVVLGQADLDEMGEAERLALVVGAAYGKALAERDEARARLAMAGRLLRDAAEVLGASSWAHDTHLAETIQAFLSGLDSEQTPNQEDTDAPSE